MIDNELFELCKEVFERTREIWGWNDEMQWLEIDVYGKMTVSNKWRALTFNPEIKDHTPLYTSDYLLEKLPKYLLWQGANSRLELVPQGYEYGGSAELWCATYAQPRHSIPILEAADTPLKALLKLVIALDDAGVKL